MDFKALRTLLLRAVILLLITFVADRVIAMGLRRVVRDSQYRFSVVERGAVPQGILVLGDSRGVFAFHVLELRRLLKEPVFSLAYNSMSTVFEEAMLRDVLARNPRPRMIVIEITNVEEDDRLLDGQRCYWHWRALGVLAAKARPRAYKATRLSHLFALNSEGFLRALYYMRKSDQDWANYYTMQPALLDSARMGPPMEMKATADNLAALTRIRTMARDLGIPVRLLVAPYLVPYAAHFTNWQTWLTRVRATGPAGERIWDYSTVDPDSSHFADRVHLNVNGSIPLARRLVADSLFVITAADSASFAAQR